MPLSPKCTLIAVRSALLYEISKTSNIEKPIDLISYFPYCSRPGRSQNRLDSPFSLLLNMQIKTVSVIKKYVSYVFLPLILEKGFIVSRQSCKTEGE